MRGLSIILTLIIMTIFISYGINSKDKSFKEAIVIRPGNEYFTSGFGILFFSVISLLIFTFKDNNMYKNKYFVIILVAQIITAILLLLYKSNRKIIINQNYVMDIGIFKIKHIYKLEDINHIYVDEKIKKIIIVSDKNTTKIDISFTDIEDTIEQINDCLNKSQFFILKFATKTTKL